MVNLVQKIDSNSTGLRICEEDSTQKIGTLPAASKQIWYPQEPNSYADFGAQTKTVARMPINASRQLKKGVLTDLDPAGGYQNDLTQDGVTRLLQGFFFANLRESYDSISYNNGQTTVTGVTGSSHTFALAAGGSSLAGVVANSIIYASGFTKAANNGLFIVASNSDSFATGVLTSSANYSDAETVTIGTKVYTLQNSLTNVDGHVKIGASEALTITNLVNAINDNGAGVPGVDYAAATTPNTQVTAASGSHTVTVTAILEGASPDSIATTTTASLASWGASTLTGGASSIVMTAGGADETPPATARLELVGHQFASGDLSIVNDGVNLPTLVSGAVTMTSLPLIPGQWLWVGGDSAATEFATATNDGWGRIRSISATAFTLDKTSNELVTDAGTSKTIQIFWGKVLKNEADPALQKRRTYTQERTLGNPDLSNPAAPQAEYISGSVPNEITVNMTTAAKVELDMTFMACNYSTIDQTGTILSQVGGASAPAIASEDAFNTTSHVSRARMAILSNTDSAPTSLYAEITELKVMIKNNLKANKAIGKLGPFEITAGFFEGSGSVQAYFNQVASVNAIRNNADVSIDFALAKNNQGILFDLPLLTLQSKGLDVKINEPIMIPIEMTMGADRNFNHTVLMEFFDYLPLVAMP